MVAPNAAPHGKANGVRPDLENSTACQKSMPITSSRGGGLSGLLAWWVCCFERKSFGWTMNDQFFAGCLTSACVTTLFWVQLLLRVLLGVRGV